MAITQDYQGLLGSLTFGQGTDYVVQGISGLGTGSIRRADTPRGHTSGRTANPDRLDRRLISLQFVIRNQANAATLNQKLTDIKAEFGSAAAEVRLDLRWPGSPETVMSYFGRPGGVTVDLSPSYFPAGGLARALAVFDALDPLAYGASQSDLNNTGTFTITNDGDATTRRCTLTCTSNGAGAMSIQNGTATGDPTLTWKSTLGNGAVRTVDLYAQTVKSGSTNKVSELTSSSEWFGILAGGNSITVTNMSDCDVTWRDAWH